MYEIKLNREKIKPSYVKVLFEKKQWVIGDRLVNVPKELFEHLKKTQPNNFLFYENKKRMPLETPKAEIRKELEKTTLEGTIEKKEVKKKKRKKILGII